MAAQLAGAAKDPKAKLNVGIPAKTKASAKRVYKTLDANRDKVLKANKPPNTNAWCDPKNGRWRISHNKGHMRSVSWTHVGEHIAFLSAFVSYGIGLRQKTASLRRSLCERCLCWMRPIDDERAAHTDQHRLGSTSTQRARVQTTHFPPRPTNLLRGSFHNGFNAAGDCWFGLASI